MFSLYGQAHAGHLVWIQLNLHALQAKNQSQFSVEKLEIQRIGITCVKSHILLKIKTKKKKVGEKKWFRRKGGSSATLHFENKYSFAKGIFFYLTPLLGQQISAAVIFAAFRNDFISLVSFNFSILYNLKPVLARMEISDIKLFLLFLLFWSVLINIIVTTLFLSRSTYFYGAKENASGSVQGKPWLFFWLRKFLI